MKKTLIALATALVAILPRTAPAHEGHAHKVMGTVVSIDAAQIQVETKEGKKATYLLTKETKFLREKASATLTDVKVGSRVVLSVVEKAGKTTVTEIQLPPVPKA